MNLTKLLSLLCLALLCGAIGYKIGERESKVEREDRSVEISEDRFSISQEIDSQLYNNAPRSPTGPESKAAPKTLEEILTYEDDFELYLTYRDYLLAMNADDVEAYLAEIEALPPSSRKRQLLSGFYGRWGELDGPAAFQYAKAQRGRDRGTFLSSVARGWARSQPLEAYDAIMAVSNNGSMFNLSVGGVLGEIAKNDLKLGVQLALGVGESRRVSFNGGTAVPHGIGVIINGVEREGNYAELYPVLIEQSDPTKLGENLEALFQSWGKYSFEEPLKIIEGLEDTEMSNRAMAGFLKGWALTDGEEAFRYAMENQGNQAVSEATSDITQSWIRGATADEIDGIVLELSTYEDQSFLDSSIFHQLSRANPVATMSLAEGLDDKRQRERALSMVLGQ